ncbi:MAG: acyl-CoA desaturase [Actinomycetota bacterium]|nr:acyl-CoA desaturase [Actinomycetota bacterium]
MTDTAIAPVLADTGPPAATGEDRFTELMHEVKAAGLLDPKPAYYMVKISSSLALLGVGWAAFALVGNSWWQLVVAALLGFCYTQLGFVGHDIGHRQVARSRTGQDLLGWSHGNLLLGFSYGWWVRHHNKHHSYPNHLERDSDITRRRVIFIPEQGPTRKGRPKQFIVRHQHVLFYPLLMTEGLGLRVASFKAVKDREMRRPALEGVLVAIHLVAYITAVATALPPVKAVVFVLVHQALFGLYIGSVFAPNHKGMPIQRPDQQWDWLTRQVVTSRNLRSSHLTDFVYGGLNYQIEHHLFPTMPRKNLRHARPIVMRYCHERGIRYYEVSVARSFVEILGHLRSTTRAYQALATANPQEQP